MEKTRVVVWNDNTHYVFRLEIRNTKYELVFIGSDFLVEKDNFFNNLSSNLEEAINFFNSYVKFGEMNLTIKKPTTNNEEKYTVFMNLVSKTKTEIYKNHILKMYLNAV